MSRKRYTIPTATLGVLAAAALLAGCGGMTPGTAQPTGGSDSSTGSDGLPKYGAPAVAHPLDTTKFASTAGICSTLSKSAQTALHMPKPGEASSGTAGPMCSWHIADNSTAAPGQVEDVSIEAGMTSHLGLSAPYGNRAKFHFFQPLGEIEGYPALIADAEDQRASLGECAVNIGVTNQLTYAVSAGLKTGAGDPCESAKQVAKQFVVTVKGAS